MHAPYIAAQMKTVRIHENLSKAFSDRLMSLNVNDVNRLVSLSAKILPAAMFEDVKEFALLKASV